MSNIPKKIKRNIDKINGLKDNLFQWEKLKGEELVLKIKEFEKTPRLEVSIYYNDLFNDLKLASTLIDIYRSHKDDAKLTVLIVSVIGNMLRRYKLPETKEIYDFMLENAYKKQIGSYVSIFLPRMEHFKHYDNRWKYFMDVKEMTPKKVAENSFEIIIKAHLNEIPGEYKMNVKAYFVRRAEGANNEYGKQYYLDIADNIE